MFTRRMMSRILEQCCVLTLLLIILQGCANPLPPSGGPRDTEPPRIVRTVPLDKTIKFDAKTVLIEFSEYVDRAKALQSIMITPAVNYEASWSGRELELEFMEPLQQQITYALSIGTDYADYAGNRPNQSHTIIFSTGHSLDSGMIQGNILGQSAGAYVFLFPVKDSASFDPCKQTTPYKTQIGANGQFTFNALRNGIYRIYAVQDMFKDGLYDIGTDGFAMATRDIVIPSESQSMSMKVRAPEDTVSPMISLATGIESGILEIRCTEPLIPESINKNGFSLWDKDGRAINIYSAYSQYQKSRNILLEYDIKSIPMKLSITNAIAPKDSAGNVLMDTTEQREIETREQTVLAPSIHSLSVKDSAKIALKPNIELILTHSIDLKQLQESITLKSGANSFPLNISAKADNHVIIQPTTELAADSWHVFTIQFKAIKDKRGSLFQDTIISMKLKTTDEKANGAIKGEVMDIVTGGPYIIIIKDQKGNQFTHKIEQKGPYILSNIPVGTYTMDAFEDRNNDGMHDFGSLKPFRFSERITHRTETITVRPRWTMDGINIQFREP